MTVHDRTRLIGQLQLLLKQYVGVSQAFIGENVTQTVIQTRHTNGCSISNVLKRGNRYSLHFRLPSGGLFRASLGCDSASRARFISSRLSMFISLVKSSKMEPALLLDIVQKMKKLEQKDIDDYLLSIQVAFYTAAKKSPQKRVVSCESQVHWLMKNVMCLSSGNCLISPLNKTLTRYRQIQSSGILVASLTLQGWRMRSIMLPQSMISSGNITAMHIQPL